MTKEEFNARLKELGLSQRDFSSISDTPYSTINNWGFNMNGKIIPVPKWVGPFLEHYDKSRKYDYLINEVFNAMEKLKEK
jgi:hypothetical protein